MTKNLYLDIHVLQELPPSNINRDDNGTPKQALYGGVQRLRVSSQAWKRATRLAMSEDTNSQTGSIRTKRLAQLLADRLEGAGVASDDAPRLATAALSSLGISPSKNKETELAYLLFFGSGQLGRLTSAITSRRDGWSGMSDKELAEDLKSVDVMGILGSGHPYEVAMFGRMVAERAGLNVDAAVQVAHALSTHRAGTEFDYFTAVDDVVQNNDETGAGMIGNVEFNSATLYRFATIDIQQLLKNLDGDVGAVVTGVGAFLQAFSLSMPTGHQTSFAPRTRPALVAVVIREDQPVNLVSAFETPVQPSYRGYAGSGGYTEKSITKLAETLSDEIVRWGDAPRLVVATYRGENQAPLGDSVNFSDLVKSAQNSVNEWLDGDHA